MFEKIGQFATRYRLPIIGAWIALAIMTALVAPSISDVASSDPKDILPTDAPYVHAEKIYEKAFPAEFSPTTGVIVIDASSVGGVRNDEVWAAIGNLASWLNGEDAPSNIISATAPTASEYTAKLTVSQDGMVAIVPIRISTSSIDPSTADTMSAIDSWLENNLPEGVHGYQTGEAPVIVDTDKAVQTSVDRTIWVTIILVIVLLLIIYRSPVSPLVPLMTVTVAYFISQGLVAMLGKEILTITSYTKVMLVVVMYGAGTDYCLFLISRFHEEMADDSNVQHATRRTVELVGETISSSAATVFVGFMAMALAEMGMFKTTGPALAVGVVVVLLAGLTFTPALLATLGEHAFWPGKATHRTSGHFYGKLARLVSDRPLIVTLLIVMMMAPFSVYAFTRSLTYSTIDNLPDDKPAVEGFNALSAHMDAGNMLPLSVVLTERDPNTMAQEIVTLTNELAAVEGVAQVRGLNTPFGQNDPDLNNLLRVDSQLRLSLTLLDTLDLTSLDPQQITALVGGVQQYLDVLVQCWPEIAQDENYLALEDSLAQLGQLSRVDGQLMMMSGLIVSLAPDTDAQTMMDQLNLGKNYIALLGAQYPDLATNENYTTASEIVNGNPMGVVARRRELIDAINGLAAEFATRDDATFIPTGDNVAALLPLLEDRKAALVTAINGLADTFATIDNAYYLPTGAGDLFAPLKPLFDRYLSADGTAYRLEVILGVYPTGSDAMDTVTEIRHLLKDYEGQGEAVASGGSAIITDSRDTMNRDQVRAFGLVLLGIFLVLTLMLRSLVAPIYLIATVVLSFSATLGVTNIVYQVVFGVDHLAWWMPFFTFVFLVALGIDYNIFLVGRMKEEVAHYGLHDGMYRAVSATGPIIGSAGIILAGTFVAMMAGEIKGLAQIGFAVSFGVIVEAFVVRPLVVPALTTLCGKWAWWPGGIPTPKKVSVPKSVSAIEPGD